MISDEALLANQRWCAERAEELRQENERQTLRIVKGLVSILSETMTTETMITSCVLRTNADPRLTRDMINAVKPMRSH